MQPTLSAPWFVNAVNIRTKAVNYSIIDSDCVIFLNAANLTATLPDAVGRTGKYFTVKIIYALATSATLATVGGQNIDTADTYSLTAQNKYVTVISDGSNWKIIANN